MTYKIEKNIPPPTSNGKTKYPFHEMEVSDRIFVPCEDRSPATAAYTYGSRHGVKFTVRKVTEDGVVGLRIWRIE